jgi:hypothetical protein
MSQVQTILKALVANGTSNYDDLEASTKITRNKLRWSCNAMKTEGHIKQVEDPLTREVAWQITPSGRNHLTNIEDGKPKASGMQISSSEPQAGSGEKTPAVAHRKTRVAGGSRQTDTRSEGATKVIEAAKRDKTPAEPASDCAPTEKACCNAARVVATTASQEVSDLRSALEISENARRQAQEELQHAIEARNRAGLEKDKHYLPLLKNAESQRDTHFSAAEDYKAQLEIAKQAVTSWLNLASLYGASSLDDMANLLGHLKAENVALKTLNASMPGFGATHLAISEGPFVVRTPNRPPRFTSKHKNAHAVAMSAARRHGFAEVFALVPVGKAVRGAEWKPK